MRKNLPFTVTAPHVLPEMRYCKLENGKYADTAEFFLDKKADCTKGKGRLEKLFPFRQKDGFPFLVEKWEKGAQIVQGVKNKSRENKFVYFFRDSSR